MNNKDLLKKKHKWYVILLAVVGIVFALPPGTLLGLAITIASLIVAKATKSSEQLPLVAILFAGLATMIAFFIPM